MIKSLICLLAVALPLAAAERPNILLIVSDDLTASALGCYGNEVCQTPHLDRLAASGVRFDRAYCQYPVCVQSRASFMSGLYPNRLGPGPVGKFGSYRAVSPGLVGHPSIGGFLRRNGYYSARVSKIFHMGVPLDGGPGGDDPDSWDRAMNVLGPETYSPGTLELLTPRRKHYGSNFARVILPDMSQATQSDHMAATQAIGILERRVKVQDGKPFFLAVGFVRPHVPLVAPKRLFALYPDGKMAIPYVPEGDLDDVPEEARRMENMRRYYMNEIQKRKSIAGYYASVAFMDEQVGRVLSALDRLDLRKNTIVVFTSDHGYNLGEHDCWQKLSLFEDSVRVPLLISAPGFAHTAGQASEKLVELIDLYPTFADFAGAPDKAPPNLHGAALQALLDEPNRGDWDKDAYTISYHGEGHSLRTSRWRFNRWAASGGEELYDHENDPREFTNLTDDPAHAATLKEMRKKLEEVEKKSHQWEPGSRGWVAPKR